MGKDYYAVLGCDKKATADELKKAYRKLALKWHPDRCPPDKKDAAQKKFQEVGEAFEVLSDPEKRAVYDQVGFDGQQSDAGVSSGGQTGLVELQLDNIKVQVPTSISRTAIQRTFFGHSLEHLILFQVCVVSNDELGHG